MKRARVRSICSFWMVKCFLRSYHQFQTVPWIALLVFLGTSSIVLALPAENKLRSQPNVGGKITLNQVFMVAKSQTTTAPPVGKTSESPSANASTTSVVTPDDESAAMNVFKDGVDALDMQNFEEAAGLFKKAAAMEPQNLEYQYYIGVTYVQLKKNREALEIFETLITKDPHFFKAYFDIAAIFSSEKNHEKAIETLKKAGKINPKSGRVFLDMGYAYKASKDYGQAIVCFSRARELDPHLNQISVFMTGATLLDEEQYEQATQMFNKAAELDPETPLAENARQTIPRVEEAAWARKPWYLITSFNWGYDDNLAREPLDEVIGGPITSGGLGKGDEYQTFFLRTGYKFLNLKDMESGVGYTLFSLGYRDWTESNVTSQSPHAYFQANWDPVFFRFQYDFTYFYSGGKKQGINPPIYLTFANNSSARLRMHSFMPTISIIEPYNLRTDINLGYQIKDYLDGVTSDASRYAADITQSYKIPGTPILPRIGYRTAYEKSGDDPSTYSYHELMAGVCSTICWGIWGDLSFAYMRTHYPNFTPTQSRRDSMYTTTFSLKRSFLKRLLLSFSYIHIRNNSDYLPNGEDLYSFKENLYSLGITYTF